MTEILAPAGDIQCALAAFEAGADAVYLGLEHFSARERATNFTFEDYSKIVRYAHENKRKVYLTLNTLLTERELPDFAALCAETFQVSPDAVIVQDWGAAHFLRRYFPHIALHGSTQMGLHNSDGLTFAAENGFSRVILERQLTFDEIRTLAQKSPLELEVFIHGALCLSLSGRCLFSSWQCGGSGNRGKCRQSCRRLYRDENGENGFFLSPNDLALLECLPELQKAGVHSFKIEGRLRKSDHLFAIVSACCAARDGHFQSARAKLEHVYNRPYTQGFYTQEHPTLCDAHQTGAQGLCIGHVIVRTRDGVMVQFEKAASLGDRIRLQSADGHAGVTLTLTRLEQNGRRLSRVVPGQTASFSCADKVEKEAKVYRIGESFKSYERMAEHLPLSVQAVPLTITVRRDGITVNGTSYPAAFEPAKNCPATEEQIRRAFAICGEAETRFAAGEMTVTFADALFVPDAVLKKIRQQFWRDALKNVQTANHDAVLVRFACEQQQKRRTKMHTPCSRTILRENTLPPFIPEAHIPAIEKHIRELHEKGEREFRLTHAGQLVLFRRLNLPSITLRGTFPFTLCNTLALAFFERYALASHMIHVELSQADMQEMVNHTDAELEELTLARVPLLVTRGEIAACELSDTERTYTVKKESFTTVLLPPETLHAPLLENVDYCTDKRYPLTAPVSSFNAERGF